MGDDSTNAKAPLLTTSAGEVAPSQGARARPPRAPRHAAPVRPPPHCRAQIIHYSLVKPTKEGLYAALPRDVVFIGDALLQFVLMYPTSLSHPDGSRWEDQPRAIACHLRASTVSARGC